MKKSDNKVLTFVRRNALYLILAACILAVGLSVTFMLINRSRLAAEEPPFADAPGTVDPEDPTDPVVKPDENQPADPVDKVIKFIMPVKNATSVGQYCDTMAWSNTLKRYTAHMAVDFFAPEGTEVMAVWDGVVESVTTEQLEGTSIVIDHGNGLKTIYNSLADGDGVTVGQSVKAGDVIGTVSVTNRKEYKDGAHLHFSVAEDGKTIDPAKYLDLEEK